MQTRAASHLARCGGVAWVPSARRAAPLAAARPAPLAAAQQQVRNNGFIKQVMDQVKKDMEKDPKMRQDWEKAQKTSQRLAQRSGAVEERLGEWGESLKSASSKTSELLSSFRDKATSASGTISSRLNQATEENESLKKASEYLKKGSESGAASSRVVFTKTRETFSGVMDKSSKMFNMFSDEDKKAEKTKRWAEARAAYDVQRAEEEAKAAQMKAEGKADGVDGQEGAKAEQAQATGEGALVVSEERTSSWDRLGAGLRDMPFLNSVFENPLFDRVFGESEIAASIREMKEIDYAFRLEDFAEDVEYVVAPHVIRTFLEGDQEALKAHCGEAAFNAVNASIKTRLEQKLTLDQNILAGPKEVNLVSAKLNEKGPPSFIWTFQMQQVNCLRDGAGDIIEGAVDDIRTVCYAMAINRHPDLEAKGLEYPWQISELAILWNQPCL
eukprot:CAMPEP_0195087388 /NCGR_PEP_ID=MMETSP0448-20130528/27239_1 /TAXON_ID=66468 /ORGANISM="Heterocapsa triquestra, Strain CCMP 448" /LENGTH=442 /DNA_ID=CAMNT_0040120949 /DNA_START=1 /DNA_END=1329 /DNA_ORIENTATION=+